MGKRLDLIHWRKAARTQWPQPAGDDRIALDFESTIQRKEAEMIGTIFLIGMCIVFAAMIAAVFLPKI